MIIGLSGYARAGKDSVGEVLIQMGFVRVSFADKLRAFLRALDPLVTGDMHLTELLAVAGWEGAKDFSPEVRNLLQRCGTEAGRQVLGENVWVDATLRDLPASVVVTDVRFPNEARAIKQRGGRVVRVTRPGFAPVNAHPSETALDGWAFDQEIVNDGDLADLRSKVCGALL